MTRILPAELCAGLILTLTATASLAHATLEPKTASQGASYRGIVQINHGCGGAPTTRVRVVIPEGVVGAKPIAKPGWVVATEKGPYARPYPHYHGDLAEGVKAITWSGGSLPDDQVDEFGFVARVSDAFAPGSAVYFPVEQDCPAGRHRWSEIPAAGQSAHDLKAPAPSIRVVAAETAPASAAKAGSLTIEGPWARATPGGATVAAGYVRITNRGAEADRLTGAAIPVAGAASVHAMTMEGDVMRMGAVEGGLTIEPGQSVELKPGGYHIMFEGLTEPLKAGETVEGTLTFARAGTVLVRFAVAPIGARGPTAPAAGHQH